MQKEGGELTPKQIVKELDKYIIGQDAAKRMVAIALRNRWRRQQVTSDLREEIMPMKGKNPIERYIRVWQECVDVFGKNEVYTMIIAGLGETDENILRGVELAANLGVVASIVPHTPMRKAVYSDMEPPSVERMLYLYEEALPIYDKYGLKLYGGTGGIYTSLKGM